VVHPEAITVEATRRGAKLNRTTRKRFRGVLAKMFDGEIFGVNMVL